MKQQFPWLRLTKTSASDVSLSCYRKPVFLGGIAVSFALVVAVLLIANPIPSTGKTAEDSVSEGVELDPPESTATMAVATPEPTVPPRSAMTIDYGRIDFTPAERDAFFAELTTMEAFTSGQLAPSEAVLVYATATEAAVLIPFVDAENGEHAWLEIALFKQGDTWQTANVQSEDDLDTVYFCDADQDAATQLWSKFVRNGRFPYLQYRQYISDADGDGTDEIFTLVTSSSNTTEPAPCVLWCYHDRTYEKIGEVTVCDLGADANSQGEDAPHWMAVGTRKLFTLSESTGLSTWANVYTVQDGEVIVFEGVGQSIAQGDESVDEASGDFTVMVSAYDADYMLNASNDDFLYTGRTTKPYSLYWDEETCMFCEYGAIRISIESLGAVGNIDAVTAHMQVDGSNAPDTLSIDAAYQFANDTYKINYHVGNDETGSCYYLAYRLENGVLIDETPTEHSGWYLPAAYPEVAVYPVVSDADIPLNSDSFWNEVIACVNALNDCYTQNYDIVQRDENEPLRAGFLNEQYHPFYPDILFPAQNIDQYSDEYYLDNALTDYYLVTNYQTLAQLNDDLLNYLSQYVIDGQLLISNFVEYEGALYLLRGAQGYGAYNINIESLTFIKYENAQYFICADAGLFEEMTGSVDLTFEYVEGRLILTEVITH